MVTLLGPSPLKASDLPQMPQFDRPLPPADLSRLPFAETLKSFFQWPKRQNEIQASSQTN